MCIKCMGEKALATWTLVAHGQERESFLLLKKGKFLLLKNKRQRSLC